MNFPRPEENKEPQYAEISQDVPEKNDYNVVGFQS